MDYICFAKKKNGELCKVNLTDKNRNKKQIGNESFFVCGRHKKVESIDDIDISKYKSIEKDFEKKINLNNNKVEKQKYFNEDILYPFTMPIMCFSCNTVISRIDIFNKLWKIHNNNINNKFEDINKMLEKEKIDKDKWKKKINNDWWQKIGGFEKIIDGIKVEFMINNKDWKYIGIENLCCRSMIYTHKENPLFVYGPYDY